MLSIILTLPFVIALAAARKTVQIIGDGDAASVTNLYLALGGTFDLSGSGIPGLEEAYVSHIGFGDEFGDYVNALKANSTWQTESKDSTAGPSGLVKRAYITVDSTSCAGSENDDQLVSVAIQEFIAGPACTFVVNTTPYVYAVVGVLFTNVICGPNGGLRCSIPLAVIAAVPGVYIGPGIQQNCDETLAAITARCANHGGGDEVTVHPTGASFDALMFATTEDGAGACGGSQSRCATYDCGPSGCQI